jgi:hypothetical protein
MQHLTGAIRSQRRPSRAVWLRNVNYSFDAHA